MKKIISVNHEYAYGRTVELSFDHNEVRSPESMRLETYINNESGKAYRELIHHAGNMDQSVRFVESKDKYNSKCSCCYLGFSHTIDLHNKSIREAVK